MSTPYPPPPTTPSSASLVLTDLSSQETITASFNVSVNLLPPPGWSISVSDPATAGAPIHVFPIPFQVTDPPNSVVPVSITLLRGGTTWATLTWREEDVTALPLTTPSSSATSTATSPGASATSTRSIASSTTRSSAPPSSATQQSQWINRGEVAGIGVGSAIAGGLLVFLAGFCYVRRTKADQKHNKRYPSSRNREPKRPVHQQNNNYPPSHSHEPNHPPEPQTIEDESLKGEASRLEGSIRNYVDNYLAATTAAQPRNGDYDVERDAKCSRYAAHETSWQKLFLDGNKKDGAWRMFIARVLAARVDARGPVHVTLLPSEALRHYQAITTGREPKTHYEAWCKVQASMIQEGYRQDARVLGPDDARNKAVNATVRDVKSALEPFRHKKRGAESEDGALKQIVVDAALFGWHLFSQTDIIELFWSESPGGIEVFPGVLRTIRDGGHRRTIRVPSRQ